MTLTPGGLQLVAKPHGHGGYSPWRTSRGRGGSKRGTIRSFTEYGLWSEQRPGGGAQKRLEVRLGTLHAGATDEDLVDFWVRAIYAMRKRGLDEDERRAVAGMLMREGVPLPSTADWAGVPIGAMAEAAAELGGFVQGDRAR